MATKTISLVLHNRLQNNILSKASTDGVRSIRPSFLRTEVVAFGFINRLRVVMVGLINRLRVANGLIKRLWVMVGRINPALVSIGLVSKKYTLLRPGLCGDLNRDKRGLN